MGMPINSLESPSFLAGSRFLVVDSNGKKSDRHPVAICHLVRGPGISAGELRAEPFHDRLAINTLVHPSLKDFSGYLRKAHENQLQVVAAVGRVPLAALLQAEINAVAQQASSKGRPADRTINPSCLINCNHSQTALRNVATAAEQTLGIAFNGMTVEPERLLGWGFAKSVEPLDPGANPTRILHQITQSFERIRCADQRLEMSKSMFAALAATITKEQGASMPRRLTIAGDGTSLLFSLEIPCDDKGGLEDHGSATSLLHKVALAQASWLDNASPNGRNRLTAWVRQRSAGAIETGVIFDGIDAPAILIVEPRLEQTSQVSYNVA